MGLEVIVLRQHPGPDKFLLKHRHEVQQVLRGAVPDVVDHIRWHGEAVLPSASFGSVAHDPDDAFYDVVDVGKVPEAVAVVEYPDLISSDQSVCEAIVSHIRPAAWAVDGEETQSCGWYVIKFAVCMCQQLIALFRGGVEAYGVIYSVFSGVWDLSIGSVDTGR